MSTRKVLSLAVAAALLGSVGVPSAAMAAKKKPLPTTCKLLVDPEGDAGSRVIGRNSPPSDILEGDVASGAKEVKVTVKIAESDTTKDPQTFMGAEWAMSFDIGAVPHTVVYRVGMQGGGGAAELWVDRVRLDDSPPAVKFDATAKTITWTFPRSKTPALKKLNQKFSKLAVSSAVNFGIKTNADAGGSDKTYIDKQPSCLKPA